MDLPEDSSEEVARVVQEALARIPEDERRRSHLIWRIWHAALAWQDEAKKASEAGDQSSSRFLEDDDHLLFVSLLTGLCRLWWELDTSMKPLEEVSVLYALAEKERVLDTLRASSELQARIDRLRGRLDEKLLLRGRKLRISWPELGKALGMTGPGAQTRFKTLSGYEAQNRSAP